MPMRLKPRLKPMRWKPPIERIAIPAPPSTDALRKRREREREKNGRILLQVELPEAETIELLVEAGCLDLQRDYFSRQDIAVGVERFLSLARNA